MFKLPFSWMPGHWGLRGHIRDEARILYEIEDSYEQEIALAKLKIKEERPLKLKLLEIDKSHGKITSEYDYEIAKIDLSYTDENIIKVKKLEVDFKFNKLTEMEFQKAVFSAKKQPWVGVRNSNYNPKEGLGGLEFELDWNDEFIEFLSENGYKGLSDQLVVESWFNDLCKSVIAEEGLDSYIDALEANVNSLGQPLVNKKNIDDDRQEFS